MERNLVEAPLKNESRLDYVNLYTNGEGRGLTRGSLPCEEKQTNRNGGGTYKEDTTRNVIVCTREINFFFFARTMISAVVDELLRTELSQSSLP